MSFLSFNQIKECPVSAVGGIEAAQAVIAWAEDETLQHCLQVFRSLVGRFPAY